MTLVQCHCSEVGDGCSGSWYSGSRLECIPATGGFALAKA
ncbi:Hypothetical protein PMT_2752 [Prochlorococcus marinus str. MIT 9313]|uniref:Uncharacterized protein n=1 Tax=Prochlorococcus marinus (strain MIT 9313) TaxID=74547 RepID=B9ESC9_PROMM|nr:Hypothetical protein PMT_2752 [Prochlorococcus marinus str. MIT 9313]